MTLIEKASKNASLRAFLEKGVQTGVFPGAVLLAVFQDKTAFLEKAGRYTPSMDSPPMTEETLFDLASLTKPFATALALMKLIDAEKLHLDAPLKKLLPEFLPPPFRNLTPRMLLCHSAGLQSWAPFYREQSKPSCAEIKKSVRKRILHAPAAYLPGNGVLYSDLGFMLLEGIIEEIAGKTLPCFLKEHFYNPLGMKKTGFFKARPLAGDDAAAFAPTEYCSFRKRLLQGEVHDENASFLGGYSGHAGMFSRVSDLFSLTEMLLGHYYGERKDFLKPETVRCFFSRQNLVSGSTWALGWDTPSPTRSSAGDFFSKESIGHLGFTGTSVWIDLRRRITVILLTNRVHPTRRNLKIRAFRPAFHNLIMQGFT